MVIKQKSPLLPRNLALVTFGELLIVFSTKVNLLYLLYSTARRCCFLHLIKPNCLLKTFLRTLILMTQVAYMLAELFNKCMKESCFPDSWNASSVVSICKNVGERSIAKNYHSFSFLSVVSKVFEKLINNKIVII